MAAAISKLLSISSESLGTFCPAENASQHLGQWGSLGEELAQVLSQRNGFYAYESALLVRPLTRANSPLGLVEWNVDDLWKGKYHEDLADALFFAEDAFGVQFCIRDRRVYTFDPETASFESLSDSFSGWAEALLMDYDLRTGYSVCHTWQIKNEPLSPGMRLLPKVPFVCGGKYDADNLYELNEVEGMLFRASIANQLRDVPDGGQVVLKIQPFADRGA